MEQKKSEFNKVLNAWDILVIAFGAMIGWGWVVSTGGWIEKGGVIGAALGFVIGGIMIFFVGMTYAELTAAMPQCGGSVRVRKCCHRIWKADSGRGKSGRDPAHLRENG